MNFYITAGTSLNDKDRSKKEDEKEINDFFEPIDMLFGDYELRKDLKINETLFLKDPTKLEGEKYLKFKLGKNEVLDNKDNILWFFIYRDAWSYLLSHFWISKTEVKEICESPNENINKILNKKLSTIQNSKDTYADLISKMEPIATYMMVPDKLLQAIIQDPGRIDYFCRKVLEDIWQDGFLDKAEDDNYKKTILHITQQLLIGKKQIKNTFNILSEDFKILRNLFNAKSTGTYKIKNFKPLEYFTARVGADKNNRLILFLHPYESESHNPIRIPGGQ